MIPTSAFHVHGPHASGYGLVRVLDAWVRLPVSTSTKGSAPLHHTTRLANLTLAMAGYMQAPRCVVLRRHWQFLDCHPCHPAEHLRTQTLGLLPRFVQLDSTWAFQQLLYSACPRLQTTASSSRSLRVTALSSGGLCCNCVLYTLHYYSTHHRYSTGYAKSTLLAYWLRRGSH